MEIYMAKYSDRRTIIANKLTQKPYITINELTEMFPDVSSMTIRRDIEYFEKRGECIKVRGGARSTKFISTASDDSLTKRLNEHIRSKEQIAAAASKFLETGRSVFVDSGSTLLKMIPYVPNDRFTFTTTSPEIALELCKIGMPVVNIVGGRIDHENQSVSGQQAMHFIADLNIDIAIISPSGVSAKSGCTVGSYSECDLKRAVIEKASFTILVFDASKVGKSLPYTFCSLEKADLIITDSPLAADLAAIAKANNIKVIVASSDELI